MNKVILTGHSHGLGAAIGEALLARGDQVLALSRSANPGLASQYAASLTERSLDLSNSDALNEWLATDELSEFLSDAQSAVLINNAGVVNPIGPPGLQGAAQIAQAITLNVAAPLMLCDKFCEVTSAQAAGPVKDRRIVHISSGAARNAYAGWSIYCATKAALDQHARSVVEDSLSNLRIESLAPGVIDTQMQAQIRATTIDRFPAKERFDALKRDGELALAQDRANIIVKHLYSDQFGHETASDVRQFAR